MTIEWPDPWPERAIVDWRPDWQVIYIELVWILNISSAIQLNRPHIRVPAVYGDGGRKIDCPEGMRVRFMRAGEVMAAFELVNDQWVEMQDD